MRSQGKTVNRASSLRSNEYNCIFFFFFFFVPIFFKKKKKERKKKELAERKSVLFILFFSLLSSPFPSIKHTEKLDPSVKLILGLI